MYKLIPVFLLVLAGFAMADSPADAFVDLMDAFYSGDASGVEAHLSSEAMGTLNMMLMMIKAQPDQAAAEISDELQIALTGDQLLNWTATDLIEAMINSPGLKEGFPPREAIQVSRCDVDGDTGVVYLKVMDYQEEIPIAMVREDDGWKLSETVVQSEL